MSTFVKITNPETKDIHYSNLDFVFDMYIEDGVTKLYHKDGMRTTVIETPEEILSQIKGDKS